MSNQNKKTTHDIVLDFTEREVNKLRGEIAYLLENPVTKEEVERIEQRLEELKKIFYKSV